MLPVGTFELALRIQLEPVVVSMVLAVTVSEVQVHCGCGFQ